MPTSHVVVLCAVVSSLAGAAIFASGCSSSSSGGVGSSGVSVTGYAIQASGGGALQAAPGDALQLTVVETLSDGTTQALADGTSVTWTSPTTVAAQDPDNPGPNSSLPATGAAPTAFFVQNTFRVSTPGALYVIDPGTGGSASITVTASVGASGTATAQVTVLPSPTGDATRGQSLYMSSLACVQCHGAAAAGSPPDADAGDGGDFDLQGALVPFPAPPLDNAPNSGDLANDPTWSAPLLGMAVQADIDNNGVALRSPMPSFLGVGNGAGGKLGAQDFADIYAWLQTQGQ